MASARYFGLAVDTSVYPAKISASGVTPVNIPGSAVFKPVVPAEGTVISTGGYLAAGTYYVAVSWDAYKGPVSSLTRIVVPSGTTNKVVVSGIKWPDSAGPLTLAFIGTSVLDMRVAPFAAGSDFDGNGNPGTVTIDRLSTTGIGLPDSAFQRYVMAMTPIAHGGVWGAAVTSVSGDDVTIAGAGWDTDQWAGYRLALYYRSGATLAALNGLVLSNTSDTLTLDTLSSGFLAGDVVVMRPAADHITSNTIGDDNFENSFAPTGLDTGGSEIGRIIRIIGGTGAGQPGKTIASNTSTVYTINGTWDITPDSTSVWIVTEPSGTTKTSSVITNDGASIDFGVVADMPAPTTGAQSLLIEVATADIHGNHFPMRYQPFREVYVPAQNVAIGSADGEYEIPSTTVNRTLAADLDNSATTGTLDADTDLVALPFLMTVGSECIRVTAMTVADIDAMDRGWYGTTAAAHTNGDSAIVVYASPDLAKGKLQRETMTAHTTLLEPDNPRAMAWTLDKVNDSTEGWALLPSAGYIGFEDDGPADSRTWDSTASKRYIIPFRTLADGNTIPDGQGGGPYSLT